MHSDNFELKVKKMIEAGEKPTVDFKLKYWDNNVSLIHDIICLANADSDEDRYIILGVKDGSREIVGIEDNIKKHDSIINILRESNFSGDFPETELSTVKIDDKEVHVLLIKNKPNRKPYFLKKAKEDKRIIINAGAIYTRDGANNTPKNGTASEMQTQNMWEERLGIKKPPLTRIEKYIEDIRGWEKIEIINEDGDISTAHYERFPEFIIESRDEMEPSKNFKEHWHIPINMSHDLGVKIIYLKYHSTILKIIRLINVEEKLLFPIPKYIDPRDIDNNKCSYIMTNSLDFRVSAILDGNTKSENSLKFFVEGLREFFILNKKEFLIELRDIK